MHSAGSGTLKELPKLLRALKLPPMLFVVIDARVFSLHGKNISALLQNAGYHPEIIQVKGGESHKNLYAALELYEKLALKGARRDTPLLALGGGVTTDLVGFVASTFMRGIPLVLIPTTLLGQVDAAIGGKTGINLVQGKNLVGTFYHPKLVLIDVDFLKTLPEREFKIGLAEIVKMCILKGENAFHEMENLNSRKLFGLLLRSILQKIAIVSKDPKETQGERLKLNLGHTFAHALESATHYQRYTHGEAVAIGLMGACFLAEEVVGFAPKLTERIGKLLVRLRLPTNYDGVSEKAVFLCMQGDKKKKESLCFVLPKSLGNVVVKNSVPESLVLEVLKRLKGMKSK